MKKLVILVVLVLLLACGGFGAMVYLEIGPFAPPPGEGGEAKAPEAEPDPPKFVEMPRMAVPIFGGDQVVTAVLIELVLETESPDVEAAIKVNRTRLADAYLRDLHGFMPRLLRGSETLDVEVLRRRLQMVTDRTLGKDKKTRVIVQSITEQGDTQAQ